MKILVAEDKNDISNLIKIYLHKEGYDVLIAEDGQKAYELFSGNEIALCIFDIMMPKMNGFVLVQKIREISHVPILILSAKTLDQDKILGLDLGADDYITKPFSSLELVSRVNAHIRRNYGFSNSSNIIKYGELIIDKEKCQVSKNGQNCNLTATEYKLLLKFLSSPERVFTKTQLYTMISDEYIEGDENTILVHISRLREKIETDTKNLEYIKTIRGLGYKLEKR